MADDFKRLTPGDRLPGLPSRVWNEMLATIDYVQGLRSGGHSALTGRVFRQADIVYIKNTTSAARDRFHVLGVDAPLFTPTQNEEAFKNRVVLTGSMPDKDKHFGKLAILCEPIRAAEIGQARLSGICPAKINVVKAAHQFADLADGDATALRSGHAGSVQILWHEGQGYGKWAIVRLGIPTLVRRFELKTALSPGGWATAHPYDASGGADTDPVAEFDVFDAFDGTLHGRGRTAGSAGTRGYARYMADSGHWEIIAIGHQARWIRFALKADMGYGSAAGSGEVLNYWDGYDPDPDNQGVTLANCALRADHYLFAGTTGAVGLASYDPTYNGYRIVQMECP